VPAQAANVVHLPTRVQIGGSEAASACGVDQYRSRVMLWAEKTGRVEREPSEAMRWGNLLEPVVFAELERRGFNVAPGLAETMRDDERPWLTGHPDGFAEIDGEPALLEIKTAGAWAGREWREDAGAPLAYLVQVHHYFELTGYALALLAVLIGGQRLETRVVHRDDAALSLILEQEADFLGYVQRDSPPPPDGSVSAGESLARLYPRSDSSQVVRLDQREWADYKALKARREQLATVERQAAELEQRLKLAMGEAETAISPYDDVCAKWTSYDRTTLDSKALRKALPAIASEYSTTKTLRRFTLE
jgi:putative phage-type endonuclease